MRLPTENSRLFLLTDQCQRPFIQAWYSRVHSGSLDTYRVRSLGNLNIPVCRTKSSCEEAVVLLRNDYVLWGNWREATERVMTALTAALKIKDENTTCPDYLGLAYHLRRL